MYAAESRLEDEAWDRRLDAMAAELTRGTDGRNVQPTAGAEARANRAGDRRAVRCDQSGVEPR